MTSAVLIVGTLLLILFGIPLWWGLMAARRHARFWPQMSLIGALIAAVLTVAALPLISGIWTRGLHHDEISALTLEVNDLIAVSLNDLDSVVSWSPHFGGVCLVAASDFGGSSWAGVPTVDSQDCGYQRFTPALMPPPGLINVRHPSLSPPDPEPGYAGTSLLDVTHLAPTTHLPVILSVSAALAGVLGGTALLLRARRRPSPDTAQSALETSEPLNLDLTTEEE